MREKTKAQIVAEIDAIAAEVFSFFRRLQRLRLDLQQQWRVKPSDADTDDDNGTICGGCGHLKSDCRCGAAPGGIARTVRALANDLRASIGWAAREGHAHFEIVFGVAHARELADALDTACAQLARKIEPLVASDDPEVAEAMRLTPTYVLMTRAAYDRIEAALATARAERDEARANNARSVCVWCGTIMPFPNGPDTAPEQRVQIMWEHAEGCDKRPERRLTDEIDRLRAQIETLREALMAYVDWFGAAHVEGCPADDTCFCSGSAVNDAVNTALAAGEEPHDV